MNRKGPAPIASEDYLLSRASSNEIGGIVQAGLLSLMDAAPRLAEEGRSDLISYKGACVLFNHASLLLETCGFVITPRRPST